MPATDGPSAAANSGVGVSAQDYRSLDYRAPIETGSRGDGAAKQDLRSDQTDGRGTGGAAAPGPPQWPVNPQPIAKAHPAATANPSNDGGVDTGIWIGLAAAALALAAGIGFAGGQPPADGPPASAGIARAPWGRRHRRRPGTRNPRATTSGSRGQGADTTSAVAVDGRVVAE
jgi:hypothetical protein